MTIRLDLSGWDIVAKKDDGSLTGQVLPITALFTDLFVSNNTDFSSLQDMAEAFGLDRYEDLDSEGWSQFVADHSRFSGWSEMYREAYAEWDRS